MRVGRIAAMLLFGVVASLLVPGQADAQGFGIKAGVAMANLRTSSDIDLNVDSFSRESTFSGGVFLNIPLAVGFSLQPEGIYQKRRSSLQFLDVPDDVDFENYIEADYIEVPLLLRWRLGAGGSGLVLFGGPAIAFRMNAKQVASLDGEREELDVKEDTNGTDFGAVVGAGFQFGKFGVEGRYNLGLGSFFMQDDDVKFRWSTISILGSLRF